MNDAVSSITLHAGKKLQISQVVVSKQQNLSFDSILNQTNISRDNELERITIHLESQLDCYKNQNDPYCWIHLTFNGHLNDVAAGYYKNTYEENGEKKYFALTHVSFLFMYFDCPIELLLFT